MLNAYQRAIIAAYLRRKLYVNEFGRSGFPHAIPVQSNPDHAPYKADRIYRRYHLLLERAFIEMNSGRADN